MTHTQVKRFAVFSGDQFYPDGGWSDYRSSHNTIEEARSAAKSTSGDWWQIVDLVTGEVVERSATLS